MSLCCYCCRLVTERLGRTELVSAVRRFTKPLVLIYVAIMLWSYTYFLFTAIIVQYLSRNLSLDDSQASLLYMAFGILMSLTGVVFGLIIDQISVFSTLIAGAILGILGKLLFVLVTPLIARPEWAIGWSSVLLVTLIALSETMMGAAPGIGIKRYATPDRSKIVQTYTMEYAVMYTLSNISALLAYGTIGIINWLTHDEIVVNRLAILITVPVLALLIIVGLIGTRYDTYDIDEAVAKREDVLLTDDNLRKEDFKSGKLSPFWAFVENLRPRWFSRVFFSGNAAGVALRYLAVSTLLIAVKALFRHLDATMPKYLQRTFDPHYSYSLVLMVNPAIVIVLSPLVQSWLVHIDTLRTIIVGTILCSLGALLFMIPSLVAIYVGVVIFSIGEIVWSPRFMGYAIQLAPKGQEGVFNSISALPMTAAKIPVGIMSGLVLDNFCPSFGHCNGYALWGSIVGVSFLSPLGLMIIYRWVTQGSVDDQKPKIIDVEHIDLIGEYDHLDDEANMFKLKSPSAASEKGQKRTFTPRGDVIVDEKIVTLK